MHREAGGVRLMRPLGTACGGSVSHHLVVCFVAAVLVCVPVGGVCLSYSQSFSRFFSC